ncbi:histidine kinase [Neobacillus drentensis]|uniref:sensor histidine kinase n=1 Tax=Neobacillus drentensis TaxID=220684 RepID=UPI002FFDFC30
MKTFLRKSLKKQKTSILFQMILGFSLILMIVIPLNNYISYQVSSKVLMDKTTKYLLDSVIQLSGKVDTMLGEYDHLSLRIALHPAVQTYLKNSNHNRFSKKLSVYELQRIISHEQAYLKNDLQVEFMDNKGEEAFLQPFKKNSVLKKSFWYPYLDPKGSIVWSANKVLYQTEDGNKALVNGISGIRMIKDYDAPIKNIGYMFMIIPKEATESVIGNDLINHSNKVQIIDQLGNIVYSTDSSEFGKKLSKGLWADVHDTKHYGSIKKKDVQGKEMYISSYTSTYSNWTVVTYINIADTVKDLNTIKKSTILIGIFGIMASLLLTAFFSWSLSKPIRSLALRLSKIKRGNTLPHRGQANNREVEILYKSFNSMLNDLEETIKILSYKQIREEQAQLIAMKAQFQPHFLYNSLNTIYYNAIMEKQNKVAHMVLSLSDLLRYSIQPGSDFVALREDLEQLNRFIDLQRYRYEDKLQVEINVEDELHHIPVMKLLLQPIVENAISHGLESVKGRPWIICISITKEENFLYFVIEDNGIGMSEAEMKKALEFDRDRNELDEKILHTGVGLPNLQHRIKLIYGNQYGLHLSPSTLGGLKVQFNIPILINKMMGGLEDENNVSR